MADDAGKKRSERKNETVSVQGKQMKFYQVLFIILDVGPKFLQSWPFYLEAKILGTWKIIFFSAPGNNLVEYKLAEF